MRGINLLSSNTHKERLNKEKKSEIVKTSGFSFSLFLEREIFLLLILICAYVYFK